MALGFWIWRYIFQIGPLLCDVTIAQYYIDTRPTGPQNFYYPRYPTFSNPMLIYRQPVVQYPVPVVRQIIVVPDLKYLGRTVEERPYVSRSRPRRPTGKSLPERRPVGGPRYYKSRRRQYRRRKPKYVKDSLFSIYDGFYIRGGKPLRGKFATGDDCKQACASRTSCLAADYHRVRRKCYLHTASTACDAISSQKPYIHYQRAGCESLERDDGMEVFSHKYVPGGDKLPKNVTLPVCIENCVNKNTDDVKCFGIDYNYQLHTCYLHTNRSRVCPIPHENQLTEKPNSVHMVSCV